MNTKRIAWMLVGAFYLVIAGLSAGAREWWGMSALAGGAIMAFVLADHAKQNGGP